MIVQCENICESFRGPKMEDDFYLPNGYFIDCDMDTRLYRYRIDNRVSEWFSSCKIAVIEARKNKLEQQKEIN